MTRFCGPRRILSLGFVRTISAVGIPGRKYIGPALGGLPFLQVTAVHEIAGPTQSGTAFPKFYIWVTVKENGTLLEDGAVRVAAMEKTRFAVTDYLTRADIERDVDKVYQTFPRPVADKIKEKVAK
jgi:hypothetical protein